MAWATIAKKVVAEKIADKVGDKISGGKKKPSETSTPDAKDLIAEAPKAEAQKESSWDNQALDFVGGMYKMKNGMRKSVEDATGITKLNQAKNDFDTSLESDINKYIV